MPLFVTRLRKRALARVGRPLAALALSFGLLTAATADGQCQVTPDTRQSAAMTTHKQPVVLQGVVVRTWAYQLANIRDDEIAASPADLVVIDYARDGTSSTAFTAADVERLKVKPDGSRRLVLAYLSIGEAEHYRFYWQPRWTWWGGWYRFLFGPRWLGRENPEWQGNFAVRFWRADWQKIILGPGDSYLTRILAARFDGVWLDKVDASTEAIAKEIKDANSEMIGFVGRIAAQARAARPNFLVIPQNGDHLLGNASFRGMIDAIGIESLLFGDPEPQTANATETIGDRLPPLRALADAAKPVFVVEYLDDPLAAASARSRLRQLGFVPHIANRALDRLGAMDPPDAVDLHSP